MAETKEKKGFNAALYAVVAGIVVAGSARTYHNICFHNKIYRLF